LELIIVLPVLVIAIFAIVQFAILRSSQQQVEYASHLGAKMASENTSLAAATAVPPEITEAILRHLLRANINTTDPTSYSIFIEHNLIDDDGVNPPVNRSPLTEGQLNCPVRTEPTTPTLRDYVRVTVCLDIVKGELTPNLLRTLGFDITGRTAQQTTTLRFEP